MTKSLCLSAIAKFAAGVILVGALIFLPAGTLHYPQGWLLMGILFIPMFIAGLVMMAKNPALLQSRLDAREKEKEQSMVIRLSGLMFLAGFILSGLSFRFGWLMLPRWVSLLGSALSFIVFCAYPAIIVKRIRSEEEVLPGS